MALVHLAIGLALVEFFVFGWAVGRARVTCTACRRRPPPGTRCSSAASGRR